MMDKIAAQESETVLPLMQEDFAKHDVKQLVNTRVSEIKNNVIYATNTSKPFNTSQLDTTLEFTTGIGRSML